ncbi:NHL repeat-containing protein [Paenibacillus spongiae]|uniref:SMP-30/gluconolactonase/LRE family protein n=1 Tax=Paenibacillus spongiae TaxID=2909671 RepID=A0ABY5S7N2_9BACL|nr:NHL repeat-containing protein [Paenibacillus spongiae]UVI29528.1 SMP-30/gluconolactonase/LRE family protein [Paenibacillus spongiae]
MLKRKWIFASLLAAMLGLYDGNGTADAAAPYRSHGYFEGSRYSIQSLYVPERVIGDRLYKGVNGGQESVPGLNGPTGLFIDGEGYLYVSDTNNNRVVKMDDRGGLIQEFGTGSDAKAQLKAPEGLYVSASGDVYVCDTGNNRISVYNSRGEWIDEIVKPDAPSLREVIFIPSGVSMDIRGFLYVVSKGVNEGLIVISPDKKFNGFFGSNKVQTSALDRVKNMLYTEEQKETAGVSAASVSDVFIDHEGYVYTSTKGAATEQIKKYNVGGQNLFAGKNMQVGSSTVGLVGSYSGITADRLGNIFGIDTGAGKIFQFSPTGEPVFSFGAKLLDNKLRMGLLGDPVSIKTNGKGYVFVTDRMFNGVQVFRPTELAGKINKANELFNEGLYEEAKQSSQEVLKSNVFYSKAHYIIGKALYREGEWESSMARFETVYDPNGYSDSFWEWRIRWVQANFGYVAAGAATAAVIAVATGKLARKRRRD